MEIKFDSELVYGDNGKYIKKKEIYGGSVNTNFQGKRMPKEKAPCKCLSIVIPDFVVKAKKEYYHQILLEDCKYEPNKIKMENLTVDDLEKGSSDDSDSESDNDSNDEMESGNEKYNDESNE